MTNVLPFKMFTTDDVFNGLPADLKVPRGKFDALLKQVGCTRDIGGKLFMLEEDIKELFDAVRATPTASELRTGPARLLSRRPQPTEPGYLVVLGENAFDGDCPIYFGWAPKDGTGISDLLALVQKGYPGKLKFLGHAFGTPAEIEKLRKDLAPARVPGAGGWFYRCEQVDGVLAQLPGSSVEEEIEDDPIADQILELKTK